MFVDSHSEEFFGLCRRRERLQETRTDQELKFCITTSTSEKWFFLYISAESCQRINQLTVFIIY